MLKVPNVGRPCVGVEGRGYRRYRIERVWWELVYDESAGGYRFIYLGGKGQLTSLTSYSVLGAIVVCPLKTSNGRAIGARECRKLMG